MTIYQIKKRTAKTSPYFFSKDTMRFFGQKLSDFKVSKQSDGRYKISAKSGANWSQELKTVRYFNPSNNRLENE
tara:strand:+ start:5160 stop:5381 length:222 start_codon:yes stop_codon:yes gene_type:complete